MQSPLAFIRHLNDPETGQPFVLNAAEVLFLKHAFKTGSDGRLLYPRAAVFVSEEVRQDYARGAAAALLHPELRQVRRGLCAGE
jgi:hypothetical protein